MASRTVGKWVIAAALAAAPCAARGAEPAGAGDPVLRIEAGGPASPVSALAFAPDGRTLYEAGWDKVVRVWRRDERTGRFALDPGATLRIAIGPADSGVINALALSTDGAWLAVAGAAVVPGQAGFRQDGQVLPRQAMTDEMLRARGEISVFDTRTSPPKCRTLRGHLGPVFALAFAAARDGRRTLLLSAGNETPRGREGEDVTLRLWDVSDGRQLGSVYGGDARTGFRPSLAAWTTGAAPNSIRAAAAWGLADGARDAHGDVPTTFRFWDLERAPRAPFRLANSYLANGALLYLPERATLVTSGFDVVPGEGPQGLLRFWSDAALGAGASAVPSAPVPLAWKGEGPDARATPAIPRALAAVASRPGGPRDLIAVVAEAIPRLEPGQRPDPTATYGLLLVAPDGGAGPAIKARLTLGSARRIQPFLAASPDGQALALTAASGDEVRVYAVADLLRGEGRHQALRAGGALFRRATFVRKGEGWGVLVSRNAQARPDGPPPPPGPQDAIFDVAARRLVAYEPGWRAADTTRFDWRLNYVDGARKTPPEPGRLWVYQGGRAVGHITLKPELPANRVVGVELLAGAVLPPLAAGQPPVVAVATEEQPGIGPRLSLYDGYTGALLRRLSGHTATIRGVAFSEDGRFLASAADDRTVCVWALTDLDRLVGKQGALPGVALTQRDDGAFVVAAVDDDSPARANDALRPQDVIQGLVEGGKLRPLTSVVDFYLTLAGRAPGQAVAIRRVRGGEGAVDLRFTLGQAADERKPLFSLFQAEAGDPRARQWLAWNPIGPYDSSGPDIEGAFGWHFNTGRPEAPARYALAGEYRNLRREGLVGELFAAGRLAPPPPPPPRKPPTVSISLAPEARRAETGELIVRRAPAALNVALDDDGDGDRDTSQDVVEVAWSIDGGPPSPMVPTERASRRAWTADLSRVRWGREPRIVKVSARTRGTDPPTSQSWKRVRYVPPAPQLTLVEPSLTADPAHVQLRVDREELPIRVQVGRPARAPALVRIEHLQGAEKVLEWETALGDGASPDVLKTVRLRPGANELRVVAVNQDAPRGPQGEETSQLGPFTVYYAPVPPPQIQLDRAVPLVPGAAAPRPLKVEGLGLLELQAPAVRIEGKITAAQKLATAELRSNTGAWQPLEGFVPGRDTELTFKQVVRLDRGLNALQFRAGVDASKEPTSLMTLRLRYQPPVPAIEGVTFDPPSPITVPGGGDEPARVRLSARLVGAPATHPIDAATVLLNEQPLQEPATIDPKAGTITAVFSVTERTNEVVVQVRNNEGSVATTGRYRVEYARPPRVEQVEATPPGSRPFTDVTATVRSRTRPTRCAIEVVDASGKEVGRREDRVRITPRDDVWVVTAAEVPLERGANTVRVVPENEDGRAVAPGERPGLVFDPPPPPRPAIAWLEPAGDGTTREPSTRVKFLVRSASPLRRVQLVRDATQRSTEVLADFDPSRAVPREGGGFEFGESRDVTLVPELNSFRVIAANDGGEASSRLTVNYLRPPVRLVIDRVESAEGPIELQREAPDRLTLNKAGLLQFRGPAPGGAVTLCGRVSWLDERARRSEEGVRVHVWVNGFPQVAAAPRRRAGGGSEAEFRAPLVLGRAENTIEVHLRGAPAGADKDKALALECQRPSRKQQLHLVAMGVGIEDGAELTRRAVAAVHGSAVKGALFQVSPFSSGVVYPSLFGSRIERGSVYHCLLGVRKNILLDPRDSDDPVSSDVVVIYYQGGEQTQAEKNYLRLRPGRELGEDDVMPLADIVRVFKDTRGAKLMLLDVSSPAGLEPGALAGAPPSPARDEPPFGMLRFLWQGEPLDLTCSDAPEEARITTVLADAWGRSTTLAQAADEVAKRSAELKKKEQYANLSFIKSLPSPLTELVIFSP